VKLMRVEIAAGPDGGGLPATGASLSLTFELSSCPLSTVCRFTIHDDFGNAVAEFRSSVDSPDDRRGTGEPNRFVCVIDELPLVSGRYRIDVEIRAEDGLQDAVEGAARFDVEEGVYGRRPIDRSWRSGSVAVRHAWRTPRG
jgi:lipopolysaccharide transport system ATP-binding protein